MMEMRFIKVYDPEYMRELSEIHSLEIEREYSERTHKLRQACLNDIPNFIEFINQEIYKATQRGVYGVEISFTDEVWKDKDERCIYALRGEFSADIAKMIEDIFKKAGYKGHVFYINHTNRNCYRCGEVSLRWR